MYFSTRFPEIGISNSYFQNTNRTRAVLTIIDDFITFIYLLHIEILSRLYIRFIFLSEYTQLL